VEERREPAPPSEPAPSPETIERFFGRYGDDPLLFRVLTQFWGTNRSLSCASDIAAPLGEHESQVRKALLSLVLEGFVTARRNNGETTYIFTTNPAARLTAGMLLRRAVEQGLCR